MMRVVSTRSLGGIPGLTGAGTNVISSNSALGLIAIHLAAGPVIRNFPGVATVHAIGVVAFAIVWSRVGRRLDRVALCCGYIAGAEVLWRMSHASVYWEFGKYAIVVLTAFVLVNGRGLRLTRRVAPLIGYAALLIPSVVLTVDAAGLGERARALVSFNLSGPLSLTMCGILFSAWSPTQLELERMLIAILSPVVATASAVLVRLITIGSVEFGHVSNFAASGGYGPNQVSSILALGALACVLLIFLTSNVVLRIMFAALMLWLVVQSVLTFSRGGVFTLALALVVFFAHALARRRLRRTVFFLAFVMALVGPYILYPGVETYTGGTARSRFTNLNTTGRKELAKSDISLWMKNPMVGVGPGMAAYTRPGRMRGVAPHTEATRLLAEHGSLGALALLLLGYVVWVAYTRAPHGFPRGWVAALVAWSGLEMMHSAMRVAAISVLFGLALVHWAPEAWQDMRLAIRLKLIWRSGAP